ncbi:hypothetical protein Q8A73_015429 [Channa argus]|nr:hypothetical protein Q8A73_015429 [Channa argus]
MGATLEHRGGAVHALLGTESWNWRNTSSHCERRVNPRRDVPNPSPTPTLNAAREALSLGSPPPRSSDGVAVRQESESLPSLGARLPAEALALTLATVSPLLQLALSHFLFGVSGLNKLNAHAAHETHTGGGMEEDNKDMYNMDIWSTVSDASRDTLASEGPQFHTYGVITARTVKEEAPAYTQTHASPQDVLISLDRLGRSLCSHSGFSGFPFVSLMTLNL